VLNCCLFDSGQAVNQAKSTVSAKRTMYLELGDIMSEGGDTVSTEAVATRRHAGTHLPVTWWKTRTANNNLALAA
jgi:hypothetical protein